MQKGSGRQDTSIDRGTSTGKVLYSLSSSWTRTSLVKHHVAEKPDKTCKAHEPDEADYRLMLLILRNGWADLRGPSLLQSCVASLIFAGRTQGFGQLLLRPYTRLFEVKSRHLQLRTGILSPNCRMHGGVWHGLKAKASIRFVYSPVVPASDRGQRNEVVASRSYGSAAPKCYAIGSFIHEHGVESAATSSGPN